MTKFCDFILTVTLTLFSTITLIIPSPISPINNSIKEDNRIKFSKLLSSIASINKERLLALKKYNDLDKYGINGILRTSEDADPLVAVLFLNKSNTNNNVLYEIFDSDLTNEKGDTPVRDVLQKFKNNYEIANNENEDSFFNTDKKTVESTLKADFFDRNDKQVLRIFSSCVKKVIKTCKKACEGAIKDICDVYKCSSSMKKDFKSFCSSNCDDKFESVRTC